ncbi:conserved hypothetical protein [Paraburkholderia unamae]|uniref:hypothetical protein n=1 Tax=Paraburkholderia unamae TaxID=219649 RepID=UPI001CAD2A3C|nr:hypothetical protein [Paraburkholderia unamae]CAG9255039.1 conserved hypothetical protein [Paraburkholderia unamae]
MNHINRVFHADRRGAGAAREADFTRRARGLLHRIAGDLRLRAGEHDITAESARRGRGCRVALNTDRLILEVTDSPAQPAVAVAFRTRRGRKDLSGGVDDVVSPEQLGSPEGYESLLSALRLVNGLDTERRQET